jgi:hypothetical protein
LTISNAIQFQWPSGIVRLAGEHRRDGLVHDLLVDDAMQDHVQQHPHATVMARVHELAHLRLVAVGGADVGVVVHVVARIGDGAVSAG